jgi:hypothetical protein
MQGIVTTNRPSSEMFKALQTAMSNLLVTEGDRRRLRIEIARQPTKPQDDESEAMILAFQQRMTAAVEARQQA